MTRRLVVRGILAGLLALAIALVFRQGLIPARMNPLPALDLSVERPWFIDWRLAELRRDPELCRQVLRAPQIQALPIADAVIKDGCGWANAVRISSVGGARFPLDKLTCEAAAALALWAEHEVQPLAQELFGQRVTVIQHLGSYSCRNIVGNPMWRNVKSEHASANAIDISGFTLADGRQISVLRHWSAGGKEAQFLQSAHQRGCRYFRVALGPAYNAAHRDHFHFDRGILWQCR